MIPIASSSPGRQPAATAAAIAALLGADPERVGGVLDVDAGELAAVARPHDGADEVVRVGRVGARGGGLGLLDEILLIASVCSSGELEERQRHQRAEQAAEQRPRAAEWTPDSTRVCATSSARMKAIVEIRKRWLGPAM